MDNDGSNPTKPLPKHLLAPEAVAAASNASGDVDLTRRQGQGNGPRVNGILFGLMAVAALVLVIVLIAVASAKM
jgi:hypothetical protein